MRNEEMNSVNPGNDMNYRRKKNAEEMKHQVDNLCFDDFSYI